MKELLEELNGRLTYLESIEKDSLTMGRISELKLVILRVQQIFLDDMNGKN